LRDASERAHAEFLASGASRSSVTVKGRPVFLKNGYPDASAQGISNAVGDWGGFTARLEGPFITFYRAGAPQDSQCSVTYKAAADLQTAGDITEINIRGC
jgi:hypothetical protein